MKLESFSSIRDPFAFAFARAESWIFERALSELIGHENHFGFRIRSSFFKRYFIGRGLHRNILWFTMGDSCHGNYTLKVKYP